MKQKKNLQIFGNIGISIIIFFLAFSLSKVLIDVIEAPILFLYSFLFKVRICIGYDCGFICCGSGLVFIIYFLIFVPLVIWLFLSKKLKVSAFLFSAYFGLSIGTFLYANLLP